MSYCQPVHEFPDLEDILEVGKKVSTWWSYHMLDVEGKKSAW
jgi:hypothetical protein